MLLLNLLLLAPTLTAVAPSAGPQGFEIPADTEVLTTASGLEYCVLTEGWGDEAPRVGDRVLVHYTGWLEDGSMIVSSRTNGKPIEIGVGQQKIDGLNEGLQLLSTGARIKLRIPPALGYGERGRPPRIPPDATLTYEIELIEVTSRVPLFQPLDETRSTLLDSGLRVEWLTKEDGLKRGTDRVAWVEYTYWDALGECQFATTMQPAPLLLAANSAPQKFFTEALELLGEGDEALFEVPPELAFGDRKAGGLPPNSVTIWRIRVVRVFEKPAFHVPDRDAFEELPSGLLHRTIRAGHGRAPEPENQVRVHYTAWLNDGTEIASSYANGQPSNMQMSGVIPGFARSLQLVREGGIVQVAIPPYLAYGDKGLRPKIGPNATLIYVIEMIQVF